MAKTCTHCGQKNPGINTGKGCLVIIGIILIISVFISLIDDSTDTKKTNNTKQKVSNNIEKEPKEVEKFIHAKKNMRLVIKSLDNNYGIKALYDEPLKGHPNELIDEHKKDYCFNNDRSCFANADYVQINSYGYRVAILSSSKVTPTYYQQVCSAALIALSGANKELVEQIIVQNFNYASQNGSAISTALGVNMEIKPVSTGLLECSFVKKW